MILALCRFLYQLSRIEHFNERLNCLLFQSTFQDLHSEVDKKLNIMDTLLTVLSDLLSVIL